MSYSIVQAAGNTDSDAQNDRLSVSEEFGPYPTAPTAKEWTWKDAALVAGGAAIGAAAQHAKDGEAWVGALWGGGFALLLTTIG